MSGTLFDTVMRALHAAYAEGYRSGYGNGRYDAIVGEEHDESFGDAFEVWLVEGDGGNAPFPGLERIQTSFPGTWTVQFPPPREPE